jgi:hypothetical protein
MGYDDGNNGEDEVRPHPIMGFRERPLSGRHERLLSGSCGQSNGMHARRQWLRHRTLAVMIYPAFVASLTPTVLFQDALFVAGTVN